MRGWLQSNNSDWPVRCVFIGATALVAIAVALAAGVLFGRRLASGTALLWIVGAAAISAILAAAPFSFALVRKGGLATISVWVAAGGLIAALAALLFWPMLDVCGAVAYGDWEWPLFLMHFNPIIVGATMIMTVPVGLVAAPLMRYFLKLSGIGSFN